MLRIGFEKGRMKRMRNTGRSVAKMSSNESDSEYSVASNDTTISRETASSASIGSTIFRETASSVMQTLPGCVIADAM